MTHEAGSALRIAAWCGWALIAGTLLALGGAVVHQRTRAWDAPRWDPARFTVLREQAKRRRVETWVVAFQPVCPHCRESLGRVLRAAARHPSRPEVALLVIDSPRLLAERAVGIAPGVTVWWDEHETWRRRWGHRLYGEVLRFAPDGRYRGPLQL
jgi:hypothetical protein